MSVCVLPQTGWLCSCTSDAEAVTTVQSRAHRHRVRVRSSFLWFMMYAPLKYQGSFQWGQRASVFAQAKTEAHMCATGVDFSGFFLIMEV